jgi:hypothetical protein
MFIRKVQLWGILVRWKGLDVLAEDATVGPTITQNFRYVLCESEAIAEKFRKTGKFIPNEGESRVALVSITIQEVAEPKGKR